MPRHLLAVRDLTPDDLGALLDRAQAHAVGPRAGETLAGHMVATLFYEPSTRTEISFELAAKRAGAETVRCHVEHSSVMKGESLLDTVRTLDALGADAIVIRHPAAGAPHLASRIVRGAVLNGGDGMHEHPTQGLVDLLTVRQRKGAVAGLRVAIVGDIRHSRVARSAVWGFTKLGAAVTLIGPPTLLPPPGALPAASTVSLVEGLDGADVVIALRTQLERQAGGDVPSLAELTGRYGLTPKVLTLARRDAIVMHPGPMNLGMEIDADTAYGPRSMIGQQVANGVAVRMAALEWALEIESFHAAKPAPLARSQKPDVTSAAVLPVGS